MQQVILTTGEAISFAISHLPIAISQNIGQYSSSTDLMDEAPTKASDFCKFLSAMLSTTSLVTPMILKHCHVITETSMYLTIIGGLLIYSTVVIFTSFFDYGEDDELHFEI